MTIQTCKRFAALSMVTLLAAALLGSCSKPTPNSRIRTPALLPEMSFSQSSDVVDVFGFVEIAITIPKPTTQNPFTDVFVTGHFGTSQTGGSDFLSVDGFCDSPDGSVFRIRFMPMKRGDYSYSVTYWQH